MPETHPRRIPVRLRRIKVKEQRMAEIKIMQQHIINYAKTRDVYVAYRKAGYSKKFLSEHESEIILHKAAKQFFDEQNLKKLPTVKSLQAEYAQLLSEKKAMYADYQKAREEMRSLQTAKANVDRILGLLKSFFISIIFTSLFSPGFISVSFVNELSIVTPLPSYNL